jgi:two-component system chemotaxis sensor kinase CheA
VNFFSDERASELRELFFESAAELLQSLNEEALELEKHPSDPEILRTMRRTVHTLKGDSAACGFHELSELSHELEDVLTPEIAAREDNSVVQIVLNAADIFEAMLAAYRDNLQLPESTNIRELIRNMSQGTAASPVPASTFTPVFGWSEYDMLMMRNSAGGRPLFNIGIQIDPQNPFPAASLQLVRNTLQEAGTVLASIPPEGTDGPVDSVEAVLAADHDQQWLEQKCRIPAVVASVVVKPFVESAVPAPVLARTAEIHEAVAAPTELAPGASPAAHTTSENILRVDAERVDSVLDLVGELIISRSMMQQTVRDFSRRYPRDPLRGRFLDILAQQRRVLNDLQRSVMKIRMVPVEQLYRRFPRVVRDISKLTGKDVRLHLSGQSTDLDKSILDALAEPMTHLVRNAVDHGIETPAARAAAGKPEQGNIRLNAYYQANQVAIEVSDDGGGIDAQRVADKALAAGLVSREKLAGMNESDILNLIFEPGLSTASQVTEVSGRGVGLDVVKTVLERMKGTVSVHTRPGEGTTFQLRVPMTLAIIKALMFQVGMRVYAVPIGNVLEIARASANEIHRVDNHEVLSLREQVLTLVRLDCLSGKTGEGTGRRSFVIVVTVAGRRFGLIVDHLLGEGELVIKPLDSDLISTSLVSGASIMGDGSVVLILDVAAIVEKSGKPRVASPQSGEANAQAMGAGK